VPAWPAAGPAAHAFSGVAAQEDEAALSGVAVLSRWPIQRQSSLTFGDARVQFTELSGPRGLSFYDAWEVAGPPAAGHTWSNDNPWATQLLWPNRRIDYIFSATPRPGGAGHPRHTALLGTLPVNDIHPSDHYAVLSDLRY
jgi:hypothetical protein